MKDSAARMIIIYQIPKMLLF